MYCLLIDTSLTRERWGMPPSSLSPCAHVFYLSKSAFLTRAQPLTTTAPPPPQAPPIATLSPQHSHADSPGQPNTRPSISTPQNADEPGSSKAQQAQIYGPSDSAHHHNNTQSKPPPPPSPSQHSAMEAKASKPSFLAWQRAKAPPRIQAQQRDAAVSHCSSTEFLICFPAAGSLQGFALFRTHPLYL